MTLSKQEWLQPATAGRKKNMNTRILNAPGELFLGSDAATALAQGARRFRSAARAVRFAMEHAAPVSLRGARLEIDGQILGPAEIRLMHGHLLAVRPAREMIREDTE